MLLLRVIPMLSLRHHHHDYPIFSFFILFVVAVQIVIHFQCDVVHSFVVIMTPTTHHVTSKSRQVSSSLQSSSSTTTARTPIIKKSDNTGSLLLSKTRTTQLHGVGQQQQQVLQFKEPSTNVTVILIGAMHYNPTSIQVATNIIHQLGQNDLLGSVIVEQCDIRWNKTNGIMNRMNPRLQPILKNFLLNEMRNSCTIALQYNRPVILGDQRINITSNSLKQTFQSSIMDLLTPFNGGWIRYYQEVSNAFAEAVPLGVSTGIDGSITPYLNLFSYFDIRLWLTAPISFIKYPVSFLIRNPITTRILFLLLFTLNVVTDESSINAVLGSIAGLQVGIDGGGGGGNDIVAVATTATASDTDIIISLIISFVETILFARILLEPMLVERNVILARNILEQCKLYERRTNKKPNSSLNSNTVSTSTSSWFKNIFQPQKIQKKQGNNNDSPTNTVLDTSFEIIYAPEMIQAGVPTGTTLKTSDTTRRSSSTTSSTKPISEERIVVAVLGMAHCNGIMKLLKEGSIM